MTGCRIQGRKPLSGSASEQSMLVGMASPAQSNQWSDKNASALARQGGTITAILDKLDAADDSKFRNRRQAPRYSFRRLDVPVRIFHPGGTVAFKAVATRNLSSSGTGALYTGFLHIGTKVEVTLSRRGGGDDVVPGKVVFCVHVSGAFHAVGIRFDSKVSPRHYVEPADLQKIDGAGAAPTTLSGNVLHVDDSEVDRKLMAHYLKTTKITLTSMPSSGGVLEAVQQAKFNLILCEANFKQNTGEALIRQLREAGYAGRVIIVTSETAGERLRALKQSGATGMLGKPYDQAKLFALISPFLTRVPADAGVVSSLTAQPEMKSLIERYVANVKQLATDIETTLKENQLDRLRQICNSLKGSGTSYGFTVLAESAKETMRSLDATNSMQESDAQIRKLLDLCKRVMVA